MDLQEVSSQASRTPFRKLKPGPGLTPDAVSADQRRRIHEAMVTLVLDRGYDRVTVRGLSKFAGVSTHSFYRHFANLEECFCSVYEATMLSALRRAASLSTASQSWEEGIRAAVRSLMDDVASQPDAARVVLVDAFGAGSQVRARVKVVTRTFEQLLADLRLAFPPRPVVPRHLLMGMVAGAMRVARATTMAGRADELPGLADELSQWLLSLPHEEVMRLLSPPQSRSPERPRRERQPFPDELPGTEASRIGDDRERILRAVSKLAGSEGLSGLSISRIRARAGVSRRGFDACFRGAGDAFLASIEWLVTSTVVDADRWAASERGARRMHRTMVALCALAARNQELAQVALVEILDAGRDGLLCQDRLVTAGVDHLRAILPPEERPGRIAAEASLAAAWRISSAEVAAGRAKQLPVVAPLLTYVVLAPASGPLRAAEASVS